MNTPTPWNNDLEFLICDKNGDIIATIYPASFIDNPEIRKANAELIVRAVNYHDRLISQLEDCIKELERLKKDEAFHFSCPLKKCKQLLTEIEKSK